VKKAFILSLVLVLSIQGKAFAQTANQTTPADPLKKERQAYVGCILDAVEAHKKKFNSYRYKRRDIKHACQYKEKELFKAKVKSHPSAQDFMESKRIGHAYVEGVQRKAFANITAQIHKTLCVLLRGFFTCLLTFQSSA